MPSRKNIHQVLDAFYVKHQDTYDYSKFVYINNTTKGIIICRVHGEFLQRPKDHISGRGCDKCGGTSSPALDEVISDFKKTHGAKYNYDEFKLPKNNKGKGIIICGVHGAFSQAVVHHKAGHGCPRCCDSRGENQVAVILSNLSIPFESQKTFDDCRGISRKLPFDFYLPAHNLLIEFDGEQHFKPVERFGGMPGFERTKKNDEIKNAYCVKNNIRLLRIPYTEKKMAELIEKTINI